VDKADLDAVRASIRGGMTVTAGDNTVTVGQGGDGEFFLEKYRGMTYISSEEFYDLESLVAAMVKVAPISEWSKK
jgi:hypothetical protein